MAQQNQSHGNFCYSYQSFLTLREDHKKDLETPVTPTQYAAGWTNLFQSGHAPLAVTVTPDTHLYQNFLSASGSYYSYAVGQTVIH